MSNDEGTKLMVETCRLWPGKFPDDELADWCQRLDRYRLGDVLKAMDEHKNTSKFRPQVSEILARLKGKEIGSPTSTADKLMNQFQIRREHNPQWQGCCDAEVALRYWRSCWARVGGFNETKAPREGYFDQFLQGCTVDLMQALNLSQAEAERTANVAFGEVDTFRMALVDVRNLSGIKAGVAGYDPAPSAGPF